MTGVGVFEGCKYNGRRRAGVDFMKLCLDSSSMEWNPATAGLGSGRGIVGCFGGIHVLQTRTLWRYS